MATLLILAGRPQARSEPAAMPLLEARRLPIPSVAASRMPPHLALGNLVVRTCSQTGNGIERI